MQSCSISVMATVEPLSLGRRLLLLARSSVVGVLATLCDLTTLFLLIRIVGLAAEWANVPSLLPGLAVMFFGNKYFAFGDRSRQLVRQGMRFLFVEAWAFVINALLFHVLIKEAELPFLLARMLGTCIVYLGFSFPLWTFIFHRTSAPL
jgi:putative flippase GtrA